MADKNTDKNSPLLNNNPQYEGFTSENQPSPEAKKAGWQRRKVAQQIMDAALRYLNMSEADIEQIDTANMSNLDILALNYVKRAKDDDRMLTDLLDRHVPKAPQTMKFGEEGDTITSVKVRIVTQRPTVEEENT